MNRLSTVFFFLFFFSIDALSQVVCGGDSSRKAWDGATLMSAVKRAGYGSENAELKVEGARPFLRIAFPKGSVDPGGVARLGTPLGGVGTLLKTTPLSGDCLWMGYYVRFAPGFQFVKGGKLPGLAGGRANTGGKIPNGYDGFSARLMWRESGQGEVYAYLPDSIEWGTSLGRGSWRFVRGVWNRLEEGIQLNTPGKKDGRVSIWLNGSLVFQSKGLRFRDVNQLTIDGLQFESFFGGNARDWASSEDTYIDFRELSVAFARENLFE